jgi:hypothetical protein
VCTIRRNTVCPARAGASASSPSSSSEGNVVAERLRSGDHVVHALRGSEHLIDALGRE